MSALSTDQGRSDILKDKESLRIESLLQENGVNEHITKLVSLQAIDLEIDAIDNKIKEEQSALDERSVALAARETEIGELRQKIEEIEKERRILEAEMSDDLLRVKDRQSKMMQVQTAREQSALLKEIEDGKRNIKESEEKIVSMMVESEELTGRVEEQSNVLKGEKELLSEETDSVRKTIAKINKGKKTKTNNRTKESKKIDEPLLKKYDTLRRRRNGLAVVRVNDSVCQGCYMALPPQRYNMILKGDGIYECPTCQRIVYYQPD